MKKVPLITKFDPWKSTLCTCPPKLTLNPYTGCDHGCLYCYASSYIPQFHQCRPKTDLLSKLKKEAAKLDGQLISLSNSSDPYPTIEDKTLTTRKTLETLTHSNCKLQIITKSTLVTRDIDLLRRVPSIVSITITTDNDATAKQLEPHAPTSTQRIRTAETLTQKGILTTIRIDPIIPTLNDNHEKLIKTLAAIGIKHVTASTYKTKPDNWKRLAKTLPETAEKLKPLYYEHGERLGNCTYLPRELRLKLLKNIRDLADKHDIKFGTCREGLSQLNTATCDGQWLLRERVISSS